jgi:YebC/PmpR family DNA-binding regulatory protein
MAGHSKWSNIQHRKGAQDKKRGKVFTKIIREITVAAKISGPDLNSNPRLRAAVDKANNANMPKDTITRAIKRGAGGDDGANMMEMRYEGYGTNGVAVIVDCLTDNKNRTVGEVRHAFSKCGGNMGNSGCVSYLFEKQGIILFEQGNESLLMEAAIESGALDVQGNDDGSITIITDANELLTVKDQLTQLGHTPHHTELTFTASTESELNLEQAEKIIRLVDMLEDLDDVQNVYTNASIPNEILEQLG